MDLDLGTLLFAGEKTTKTKPTTATNRTSPPLIVGHHGRRRREGERPARRVEGEIRRWGAAREPVLARKASPGSLFTGAGPLSLRLQTPAAEPYPQRVLSPSAMAATLFSTALSHHFIPLPSARPAAASALATSFTCGPLRAVSALLAPRRRLLLPVAVAVSSEFETEDAEEEQSEGEGGGDSEAEYSEDLKVFVGNLPFTVDSAQLAGLFEQAGSVEMVEVVYDRMTGRSRGFGFVTMGSAEEVAAAVEQFNGYTFQGRPLRVNSGPPPPRDEFAPRTPRAMGGGGGGSFDSANKLYVGNLSWGVDNSTLENLFSEQGKVLDAKVIYDRDSGRSRGFGFVTYGSADEVNNAISNLDGVDLDGRQIRVTVAESKPREQRRF